MTLLELLVKELPEKGGWPGSVWHGEQMGMGNVKWSYGGVGCYPVASPVNQQGPLIRRGEYEAALAASKQPMWSGDGLPPVGGIVEVMMYRGCGSDCYLEWGPEKVLGHDGDVIIVASGQRVGDYDGIKPHSYRPIRTEAERRRSEICDRIYGAMIKAERKDNRSDMAECIYDAIAKGEIPGVKLEE